LTPPPKLRGAPAQIPYIVDLDHLRHAMAGVDFA
jgi:hypothetical protein